MGMRFSMKHELQLASHNPKIVCICHTMAADTQNERHRRPMNYNQSHKRTRFCFYKTRSGGAKAMKQPYAATLPPSEYQRRLLRQRSHGHNQGTRPATMRTKGAGNGPNHDPSHGGIT